MDSVTSNAVSSVVSLATEANTAEGSLAPDPVPTTAGEASVPPQPPRADATGGTWAVATDMQAWVVDFSPVRKMTAKEKAAIRQARQRRQLQVSDPHAATPSKRPAKFGALARARIHSADIVNELGADSEGNAVVPNRLSTLGAARLSSAATTAALPVVHVDASAADRDALIPINLTTTRADLEARLVLRIPRLLCVCKQYPRGCGIASLTSVYNYLYSWLGESDVGASRAPQSQEAIMSILGFEPPFGEIAWGPFTGNGTLIRWFHALNRHFGLHGRATILYKAHGHGKTTHLYADNTEALAAVKAALRDPHCALIYHCHNHYMVPIGYQDIPLAQTDFLQPIVATSNCETTVFIGEVSRGRHEAVYARKWSSIVKDIECQLPDFFNIRHVEQGVQRRAPKLKKAAAEDVASDDNNNVVVVAAPAPKQEPMVVPPLPPPPLPTPQLPKDSGSSGENGGVATVHVSIPPRLAIRSSAATHQTRDVPKGEEERSASQSADEDMMEPAETITVPTPSPLSAMPPPMQTFASTPHAVPSQPERRLSPSVEEGESSTELTVIIKRPSSPLGEDEVFVKAPPGYGAAAAKRAAVAARLEGVSAAAASNPVLQEGEDNPPAALQPVPNQTKKPKKERGNLHCIICFRNDEVEPRMDLYEEAAVVRPDGTTGRNPLSTSSSSSGDDDSTSDEV